MGQGEGSESTGGAIERRAVTAQTAVAGVIGHPVRHSLSPTIHNAALAAVGLDWVYVAWDVPKGSGLEAITGARALGIAGMSVTMPHKEAAAAAADRTSATVSALGAANTLYWQDGALVAESTDGGGFLDALGDEGVSVGGAKVVVLGGGAAARSVAFALAGAGAAKVGIKARRAQAAAEAAALCGPLGHVADDAALLAADIVVNATPVGMAGTDQVGLSALSPEMFNSSMVVVDLVYHPVHTKLLEFAVEAGAHAIDGTGMLLHQAARQFELWTGQEAPLGAMRSALVAELGERW